MKINDKSVFKENDIYANKVMMSVLCASGGTLVIVWVLLEIGVLSVGASVPRFSLAACLLMMVAAEVCCIKTNYNRRFLKYILMGVLIVSYGILYCNFTYVADILMVIPIVMSSRYFSRKYTLIVSLITFVVFFFADLWGANHGMLDLNYMEFPKGTIIDMGNFTLLEEAVHGIPYDKEGTFLNVLIYRYPFKLILATVTAVACLRVAEQGRNMVLKQQSLSEKTVGMSTELAVASKLQMDMLPNSFPAFPDRREFDLYASMRPAMMVGGDFYDFFLVDDDHLAMVMGDVSDKGVPAALFMVLSKNTIANNVMQGKNPARAMTDANNALCANNREDMFVTAWLGILEISSGVLVACNAGHEPPIIKCRSDDFLLFSDNHGVAMGCMHDAEYEDYKIKLGAGDRIFLYTDGVPEATNQKLESMGIRPVVRALNADPNANAWQMVLNVQNSIDDFVGDAEQFDDITMLALQYN